MSPFVSGNQSDLVLARGIHYWQKLEEGHVIAKFVMDALMMHMSQCCDIVNCVHLYMFEKLSAIDCLSPQKLCGL